MHRTGFAAITIQNPIFTDTYSVQKHGALERSAGGARYYYDKGITTYIVQMAWNGLREAERAVLENFFDNVVEGPKYKFNLMNQEGKQFRCWFNDTRIDFEIIDDQRASRDILIVGGNPEPTTTRTKSVWAVEVEMEILSTTTSLPGITTTTAPQ